MHRLALLLLATFGCALSGAMPTNDEPEIGSDVVPVETINLCGDDPSCVASFPSQLNGTTQEGANAFDRYSCAPNIPERGPETLIPVAIPEDGLLIVDVATASRGKDIDVHILDERDPETCLARGDTRAVAHVSKGIRYIAVDTYGSPTSGGEFNGSIQFIGPSTLSTHGISSNVADRALQAFATGWAERQTKRLTYTVIDFSLPSSQKRLWVLDLASGTVRHHLLVAHGSGSNPGPDPNRPTVFSNISESHQSSLGLMKTGETYYGMWGYSLKLDGLEPRFNDLVRERHVVIHGAECAGQDYLDRTGTLCQSWGCPTVDAALSRELIDAIKHETLVFSDYPDPTWLSESKVFER